MKGGIVENIQQEVIQILIDEAILSPDYTHDGQGTELLMDNVIDSLNIVALIMAFEKKFDIQLGPEDIKAENWVNVNSVINLVSNLIEDDKKNEKQ